MKSVKKYEVHIAIPEAYTLLDRRALPDSDSVGYLLRHDKSGARLVLMDNTDENKTFYIAFKTPPTDSTGVAHIMEHSVLCGSEHFPLKDPFVELGKGSLNTFLNAMTYPDKTVYPVASCNETDFANLMHVYLDAVFHPAIYENEQIFRQEGWHYELSGETENLAVNGVVYNEMKGVYSSPEGVLDYALLSAMYPDTSYRHESGGNPDVIPELSYEDFIRFHKTYYHPSNAYLYLYGDMDFEERLRWIDEAYLSGYDRIKVGAKIEEQEPFAHMHEVEQPYAIATGADPEGQAYLTWCKSVGSILDPKLTRAFQVLDYALLSSPGAPLKQALIDAGIGQDVIGGLDSGILQPMFSVTAKKAREEDAERFRQIIGDVLAAQVCDGIDQKALEAGINTLRFAYVEGDTGNIPKGLIWGLMLMDSWLYDEDRPFLNLNALHIYDELKKKIGTSYFEDLVRQYLIDNEHGVCLTLKPDAGRANRLEEQTRVQLQEKKRSMSPEDLSRILTDGQLLLDYQNRTDSPEALETIPVLEIADIKREVEPIINEKVPADVPFYFHETDTHGIGYADILFDMSGLKQEELPAASILLRVLGLMDTDRYSYQQFGYEVNRTIGGLTISSDVRAHIPRVAREIIRPSAEIHLKGFYDQLGAGFDLITEMLLHTHLRDEKRLREILAEIVTDMQTRILMAGHVLAAGRSMAYESVLANYKDMTQGIAFYRAVSAYYASFDRKKEALMDALESVAVKIFAPCNMLVSYTGERESLSQMSSLGEILAADLDRGQDKPHRAVGAGWLTAPEGNEAFTTAGQVQYLARSGNFIKEGFEYTGALQVLSTYLRWEYLWQNIRVKGGAYGCMTTFSRTGNSYFVSYRDPNLKRTWDVFSDLPGEIEHLELSERELRQYIIGAINKIDQPLSPHAKGSRSMNLYLAGIDDEVELLTREIIEPLQDLKTKRLGNNSPLLHLNELLIALEMRTASDPSAAAAISELEHLRGLEVHSSVILSSIDVEMFKRLGMNLTCEPVYENNKLYHN